MIYGVADPCMEEIPRWSVNRLQGGPPSCNPVARGAEQKIRKRRPQVQRLPRGPPRAGSSIGRDLNTFWRHSLFPDVSELGKKKEVSG